MDYAQAYRQFYPQLVSYAAARLGADMADDLAQDAFLEAWRVWGRDKIDNMRNWLITILRRCWFRYLRKGEPETADKIPDIADDAPDPLAMMDGKRLLSEVRALGRNGRLLEMRGLGWTNTEIAAWANMKRQSVEQRLANALSKLARKWRLSYGTG